MTRRLILNKLHKVSWSGENKQQKQNKNKYLLLKLTPGVTFLSQFITRKFRAFSSLTRNVYVFSSTGTNVLY